MNLHALESTERFEKLCKLLLLKEYPSLQTIDGRAGDQGKDSFIGTFGHAVHIFQIKYFDQLGRDQRKQVEESLAVAAEHKPDKWTLLVSEEFNRFDWEWFDGLRKEYLQIELDVWLAPKIQSLVLDTKNEGLKEIFPELFPTSSMVDRTIKKTLESLGIVTKETATSLVDQLSVGELTKGEITSLLANSRNKQYSAEIIAAQKMMERFNDENVAAKTFDEVLRKAVAEGDVQNELNAIYGILNVLGKVPEPDVRLIALADRGIELASKVGSKDALALIESEKASMLQSTILARYRHLNVTSLVLKTTGSLAPVLQYLQAEESALQKLGEELKKTAMQAGMHAFESKDMKILGTVMMQIGFSIGTAAFQYKCIFSVEDSKIYSESAEMLLEKAREIFTEIGDDNLLAYAENNLAAYWLLMSNKEKSEVHAKTALELARKTKNKYIEARMSETLGELEKGHLPSANVAKEDYTPETQDRMLRFVVKEMGFDINDPKTDDDRAVRIGIKDLNPERVLKHCQYMKLNQVNTSALGEAIGVPTIGSKRISCVKFGYGLEGFDLDDTSTSFKHVHCDSCQDRKPRSSSWKWSFDWEKNKNHEYEALDGK